MHPHNSQPWRTLVCCILDKAEDTLYEKADVDKYSSKFKPISEAFISDEIEGSKINTDSDNDFENNSDNPIAIASKKADWNPAFKLVINRSDNS